MKEYLIPVSYTHLDVYKRQPQVRPVRGLFETAANSGKTNCAFYSWEELKDIWRPGYVRRSVYAELESSKTDILLTDICLDYIEKESPDIAFLYLGMTDHEGHSSGWMSEKYLKCVYTA